MRKRNEYIEVERLVNFTLYISLSIALSIFDALIPINFILPGVKLGLANIILVLLLDKYTFKELLMFQFIRITITTFILGLFSIYLFSLSGGICALIMMYVLRSVFKEKITVYTLSITGAIFHNVGQIIFSVFYLNTIELIYYLPFLVLMGSITGFILGYIITKIKPLINKEDNVRVK